MKVAYCFFGHTRTYKQCHESFFQNVFNQAPGDIYIHTWSETSSSEVAWWKPKMSEEEKAVASRMVDVDDLKRIYRPKEILVEHQRSLLPVPARAHSPYPAYSVKVTYESMKKAFNMTLGEHYDRVFMTRMDLRYTTKLNPKELSAPKLHVPPVKLLLWGHHAATDLWLHGTQEQIKTSTDYFWEIEQRFFKRTEIDYYHELAWHDYIREQKLPIAVSRLECEIVRLFGEPTRFEPWFEYCPVNT